MTADDFPCCANGEHAALSTPPADDVREACGSTSTFSKVGCTLPDGHPGLHERIEDGRSIAAWTGRQGCQQPPVGWHCSREAGHDGPCAARPIGQHDHEWVMRQGWAKCALCGLEDDDPRWEPSSPPADDVREEAHRNLLAWHARWDRGYLGFAAWVELNIDVLVPLGLRSNAYTRTGISNGPEVRPHGTVTDAEVDAAAEAWFAARVSTPRNQFRERMRAALEAAREARS